MNVTKYVKPIIDEAKSRGVKITLYPKVSRSIVKMEFNGHVEFLSETKSDKIGAATFSFLYNKVLSREVLKDNGFPVPDQIYTRDIQEAAAFLKKYGKVVVKPSNLTQGSHVFAALTQEKHLVDSFEKVLERVKSRRSVLVQEHVEGNDHRILVIGSDIFVVERKPAYVIGDGANSISNLIATHNSSAKYPIKDMEKVKRYLFQQNRTLEYTPKLDEEVQLLSIANVSQGGTSIDRTLEISDHFKQMAIQISKKFNASFLGIDLVTSDISGDEGKIIELNPHAGILMHYNVVEGVPRDPASSFIDILFPETV